MWGKCGQNADTEGKTKIPNSCHTTVWDFFLVPGAGVEPARHCCHWCLRPTRLPIPPSGLISASRRRSFRFQDFQSLSASKPLCLKISPHQSLSTSNSEIARSEPFPWPPKHSTGSYPRPSRRIGWTKIEKIPRLQAFFPNYFQNRTPGLHRNSGGITSPPRNSPAPCAPSPGRSAPTAPPSSQHAPSPPSGNDATASRSSSAPIPSIPSSSLWIKALLRFWRWNEMANRCTSS